MKKFINISALCLTLALAACAPSEVDDLFDEPAAVRLDNAIANYTQYFQSNGGKWEMLYFANGDEQGYPYLMTFKGDGSVTMSSRNYYLEDHYYSETSLWEVIADNGPVLSFPTYNDVFHFFCSPQSDGEGLLGDYEFMIMSTTDSQAVLKGKKHGITIIMNRVDANLDEQAYFDDIYAAREAAFSTVNPYIIITTASGLRYKCQQTDMVWSFYPENRDAVQYTNYMNGIITAKQIRFMQPLDFMTEFEPDQVACQNFELQSDGSYLCVEDGVTRITAPPLAYVFMQYATTRDLPEEGMTGSFAQVFEAMKTQTAANTNFKQIKSLAITHYESVMKDGSTEEGPHYFNLNFVTNRRRGNIRLQVHKVSDNVVKFSFDPDASYAFDTANAKAFYNFSTVQEFIGLLTQGEFTITADNALNPNPLTLTSSAGTLLVNF